MRHAFLALAVACSVLAPITGSLAAADKPKKPRFDIRTIPRFGFSPVNALVIAELKGGGDVEDYYCPEIEWEWDDGGKSQSGSDCPAFEPGISTIQRRFSQEHLFKLAGTYNIRVTMKRSGRPVAQGNVRLEVKPGLGDPTIENNP